MQDDPAEMHSARGRPLHHHRRDSSASVSSFYSDVEMAQDEIFAGPTSESLPSSAASFQHRRRSRTDSVTSWSFFHPELDAQEIQAGEGEHDHAVLSDEEVDLEAGYGRRGSLVLSRKSSTQDATAVAPLLRQHREPTAGADRRPHRTSQTIYIDTEDLTIAVAGFKTSRVGYAVYLALSWLTLGMGWLIFRWFPRARVRLIGKSSPLGECDWAVVENQWNEFTILNIKKREYGQTLSTVFGTGKEKDVSVQALDDFDDDDPILPYLKCLDYRYIRFIYHPIHDRFMLNSNWKDPAWDNVWSLRIGLDGDEKSYRQTVFGDNVIDIEEKTPMQILVDEAFHPFYVFQIASLILWSLDEYYYYAICIFIISLFSIMSTLIETRATMHRLREVSRFVCDVRVLRNGFWRYVSSTDLVPGDVYEISDPELSLFPCDSLLLTGDCIVNESMLTGESVPVSKVPCTNEALRVLDLGAPSVHPAVARHFLFCGTKIIRVRKPQDGIEEEAVALAMVVRTGFSTTKGALVRSMLFPKPTGFKFYSDSFKYIAVMAGIAGLGFVVSFINFIRLGLQWNLILIRALDLITIVVPPALPATLTIGTNFALSRLKKKNIFCISPQRVNIGGKLDVVCFDKTGTLTEDGLDVLGVHSVTPYPHKFTELFENTQALLKAAEKDPQGDPEHSPFKALFNTMATCHSLRLVDDELIGDPLDLKMFEFTGWVFEEGETGATQDSRSPEGPSSGLHPSIVRPKGSDGTDHEKELGILRIFEFVSNLRRSSVIVKHFGAPGGDIYVKGAPECMREICNSLSFPPDYDQVLENYTRSGYRVIACAAKHIPNLSWIKAQKMRREDAESGLNFAGFIIFENKLKESTTPVIEELRRAAIRTVMCTGDNILTAISVAQKCKLIEGCLVFVPHFHEGNSQTPNAKILWETADETPVTLDATTLLPLPVGSEGDISGPYGTHNLQNYCMAVTGEAFRWIVDYAPEDYLNRMLVRSQIFARMSPDEKHELVEKLQGLDYCVGFCGDGANDCGALKAADVGISLSEAEASVAAPFTSRTFNISCVPQVIREGRAALVTSFSCFKYMSLYSAIQFTSVSILYKSGSNLGDFQFLFIDLLLILPIAVFMGWAEPYPTLSPKRPTASLVSRKVLTPLLGQIFIAFALQFICYKAAEAQSWYIPPKLSKHKSNIPNSANTTLFLVSCYQYIFAAVFLSVGPPYRLPMTHNYSFMATVLIGVVISTWMLFAPPKWLCDVMQLTPMPLKFKIVLLLAAAVGFVVSLLGEQKLFPKLSRLLGGKKKRLAPRNGDADAAAERKKRKYKVLEEQMRF
ncbi:P-type ATPase-like protein [Sphaerosporella brunnea]|uniref:Cation-transporting ATPase n=1 Tax=Sphaerosporella brunnea TaxID=1250544 RepID=A0A5J5F3T8_9PEZI|nr:P-type ATPase-like protein [Sphaerosporella brunnea]